LGDGTDVTDGCIELQVSVSEKTYYRRRNPFNGLKADDAKRLKDLERKNMPSRLPDDPVLTRLVDSPSVAEAIERRAILA
jgi:hypothetical protein